MRGEGEPARADDVALLDRARRGDEAAFELIVRRNASAVWRLARSLLHDDFAAEEAVQDAFLKAHRSLGSFRGDAEVRTWLLSICRNACLDRLRRRDAVVVPLDRVREDRMPADGSPELRVALQQAVAALPGEEREAFVLVDVLGHTREQAAAVVGVPASTMRSRVARARTRLALALGTDEMREGRG